MSPQLAIDAVSSATPGATALASSSAYVPYDGPENLAAPSAANASGSFAVLVSSGLSKVNDQLIGSQVDLQKLAVGDVQNLHQIMINLEEARVSFQLMMQVRNRLLEAYQDLMKMPV